MASPVRLLRRVQVVLALLHFAISIFQKVSVNSFPVTPFLMAIQAVTGLPVLVRRPVTGFVTSLLMLVHSYHSAENDYICESLINSKNNSVHMKLQTLQKMQLFIECRIMVGGASVHMSKHSLFRLKITVQAFTFLLTKTLSQVHGRLSIVRISEHSLLRLKITVGCPPLHISKHSR